MNKETLTWAAIIPLIGGMPIGMEKAIGKQPEYVLSFTGFQSNDKHYINYLRTHGWKGKYYVIDGNPETSENNEANSSISTFSLGGITECESNLSTVKEVDIVVGVPPCAGLTSFVAKNNPAMNDWMINASNFILENVKPKVFCFENAPLFATKKGEPVTKKIETICEQYGYTFLIYTTQSRLHGNPQIRPRSFAVLYKKEYFGDSVRLLTHIQRPMKGYETLISEADTECQKRENDPMNIRITNGDPLKDPCVAYMYDKLGANSYKDFVEKICNTDKYVCLREEVLNSDTLDSLEKWFNEHEYESMVKWITHVRKKQAENRGIWMHGVGVSRQELPAFIGVQPYCLLHPFEQRFLTLREGLSIMNMPYDFDLYNDNPLADVNHICQNVPVNTAFDITSDVIERVLHPEQNVLENVSYVVQRQLQNDIQIRKYNNTNLDNDLFAD